jgi:Ca-activated chloride channel family protein
MSFSNPERLFLLLLVVGMAGAYVFIQRRRRHYAIRFTNLDLLASIAPTRPGWRRHVPAAGMALAAAGLLLGLAHPVAKVRVPKDFATVMLVLDTSASMEATDVDPTRLKAAVAAATSFVQDLPAGLQVGLVSFDRTTRVVATPTEDHASVERALARLATGPGTATGDGIVAALDAIATSQAAATGQAAPTTGSTSTTAPAAKGSAAIVLLSDGATTVGRPAEQAAAEAAQQGIPVNTIAFGTSAGTVNVQGRAVNVPADPATMASVAETTGGKFFEAASSEQLRSVYEAIQQRVGYDVERRDISMAFVGGSVVLLFAALGASLIWTSRLL